jgi:hypothetical protein
VTFADYLRARRSYTETGQALKAAIRQLPAELQTVQQVRVWLYEHAASLLVIEAVRLAAKAYHQQRRRAKATANGD